MAELFELPGVEMQLAGALDLDALIEGADFAPFEAAYVRNFAAYRAFLDENRLPHRLDAPQAALTGGGLTA
jgi:hypothetical protein